MPRVSAAAAAAAKAKGKGKTPVKAAKGKDVKTKKTVTPAQKKAAEKKKALKKDRIKRAPSAFILFASAKRPEIKAQQPNASFGEIGRQLGVLWAKIDAKTKAVYQKESQKKKAMVDQARAIAKANAPPKVKRPPTPYMIFCSQARIQVKNTHPTATFAETGKILGAMWASLDERSKAVSSLLSLF